MYDFIHQGFRYEFRDPELSYKSKLDSKHITVEVLAACHSINLLCSCTQLHTYVLYMVTLN